MGLTVTDDASNIQNYDSLVGFGIGSVGAPNAIITTYKVQGTGAVDGRVTGTGVSGQGYSPGSTDVSTKHVFQWVRTLDQVTAKSADGWRIRLATSTNGLTAYKDITVGGEDTARARVNGFNLFCCNALRSGENVNGTPPAATAVIAFAVLGDHISNTSRFTWVIDQAKALTGITVTAGTSGAPGNSGEIVTDATTGDEATGRGQFKNIGGVFFVLGRVTIGDVVASAVSHFTDTNRVWLFEDQAVKNDFHRLEFVGNSGGVNAATFGTEVGSGITASGVAGNVFTTASPTSACFRLISTDANITVKLFGCTFLNSLYEDHCFQAWIHDISVPSFANRTREANISAGANGTMFPATEAANDAFYVSDRDEAFFGLEVVLSAAGVIGGGAISLAFEYHNGTAWVALPSLVDGTANLTASGRITWAKPADMSSVSVNAVSALYVRIRVVSGTWATTNPTMASARPLHAGAFRFESPNDTVVGGLFSGCGVISIRNGALFRKCTVSDSNAGQVGAIDLGAADPATNTFRDITALNSAVGILLRDIVRFLDAGAAVNKGAGLVGIPSTAHGWFPGQSITIAGTTNYNGTFTLDVSSTVNEMVITATFTAETFSMSGTAVPNTTYNFRNIKLSGNTKDVRVDFPPTSTVTINVLENGTGFTSAEVDNVNASTLVILNTVAVGVTCLDEASVAVQGARVLLEAATGGPLPFQVAVTISRASTTATVAHTAHGMINGQKIKIKGANQPEYNGVHTISNVSLNAYDYTVAGSPTTPATGTIKVTGVILSGLTDAAGLLEDTGFSFSALQPVTGKARKSSASPFFKSTPITGTIVSTGFSTTIFLVSDE